MHRVEPGPHSSGDGVKRSTRVLCVGVHWQKNFVCPCVSAKKKCVSVNRQKKLYRCVSLINTKQRSGVAWWIDRQEQEQELETLEAPQLQTPPLNSPSAKETSCVALFLSVLGQFATAGTANRTMS